MLERLELGRGVGGPAQWTGELLGAADQRLGAVTRHPGPYEIRLGRDLVLALCDERLLGGVPASRPHQADVRERLVGEVDQGLHHRVHQPEGEAVEAPQHAGEQERLGPHAGEGEEERDHRPAPEQEPENAAQVSERIGVQRRRTATQRIREERHVPKVEAAPGRGKLTGPGGGG